MLSDCVRAALTQPDVSARVFDSGAGLFLDKREFDALEVRTKVLALEQNASYGEAAADLAVLLRGAGGTERAADVLESTLALGTSHLETADLSLPFHKIAGIDIGGVMIAILCVVAVALRGCWAGLVLVGKKVADGRIDEAIAESDSEAFPE